MGMIGGFKCPQCWERDCICGTSRLSGSPASDPALTRAIEENTRELAEQNRLIRERNALLAKRLRRRQKSRP